MECCFNKFVNGQARLQWDITEKCNLDCVHCCSPKDNDITYYSNDVINRITLLIKNADIGKVTLSGGEPTLNKSLPYIIKDLHVFDIQVGIVTNLAYNLNGVKDLLMQCDSITTSIDGGRDNHNMIRGKQCYDATINNIRTLTDSGKNIKVIVTLQNTNYSDLEHVVSTLSDIGVNTIMLAHISPMGKAKENYEQIKLSITKKELQENMIRLSRKYNVNISSSSCSHLAGTPTKSCLGGKYIYYLSPDLYLSPCHLRREIKIPIFDYDSFKIINEYSC